MSGVFSKEKLGRQDNVVTRDKSNDSKLSNAKSSSNSNTIKDSMEEFEAIGLREAKLERLRVEENAKKLENRILLLEKEKQKVNKKIDQIKKKAQNIFVQKQKAQEEDDRRQQLEAKRVEESKLKHSKIQEQKIENESRLNVSKLNSMSHSMIQARTTKETLKVHLSGTPGEVQREEGGDQPNQFRERGDRSGVPRKGNPEKKGV